MRGTVMAIGATVFGGTASAAASASAALSARLSGPDADPAARLNLTPENYAPKVDTRVTAPPAAPPSFNANPMHSYRVQVRGTIDDDAVIDRVSGLFDDATVADLRQPMSRGSVDSLLTGRVR